MKFDAQGFCSKLLAGSDAIVQVPYGVPAHGMILFGADYGIQVSVLPVCAMEDVMVSRWLGLNGIYRVDDLAGMARIGQGQIANRMRRHRAHPKVLPVRLTAMTGLRQEWTFSERCYLEERFALDWIGQGLGLVSSTFNRGTGGLSNDVRAGLDRQLAAGLRLIRLADRILDHDADELTAVDPGMFLTVPSPSDLRPLVSEIDMPVEPVGNVPFVERAKDSAVYHRFADGTDLMFTDGWIVAYATARTSGPILHAGSTVHLAASPNTGRRFADLHQRFLDQAGVTPHHERVGRTGRHIGAATAAQLMKLVTAGRVHSATKWRAG